MPKLKSTYKSDPAQEVTKTEKEIPNENIDAIRARQLSHQKIKSYSLQNKIKILLLNSKSIFFSTTLHIFSVYSKYGIHFVKLLSS